MTKLQKKSLWVLGWLASVAAAFAGGIWAEEHFIIRSQATSIFTQELVVAIDAQRYLENLDRGKPKELREDLITTLNSKIMLLSAFTRPMALQLPLTQLAAMACRLRNRSSLLILQ